MKRFTNKIVISILGIVILCILSIVILTSMDKTTLDKIEFTLKEIGCDYNDAKSCNYLANTFFYGKIVREDIPRALELYNKSCEIGFLGACETLGFLYTDSDANKSIEYYEKACYAGEAYSCNVLGNIFSMGDFIEVDMAKAQEYYGLSCDKGYYRGCTKFSTISNNESK